MAYSELLADRVRQRLHHISQLEEKKMMGGLIFMVNGKMCIGVDFDKKRQEDRLMVRLGKAEYESALAEKGSRIMDFTGKPLRGFVYVDQEGFESDEDLASWVDMSMKFVFSLPPK